MAGLPHRSSTGDFHIDTLRFMAGQARRALAAHDVADDGADAPRGANGRRLARTAQVTQARLAAALARRRATARPR